MKNLAPIWRGQIENGELKLAQPSLFKNYLSSLRGEVEIIVRKWKKRRSSNQNKYYWGVVVPIISKETGYSNEEAHEALKWKFLRQKKRELLPTVKSTTGLSTIEFNNYIEEIVKWAGQEMKIMIPEPDKVDI